jgi:predicted ArsR family transcriptional regulator
MLRQVDKQFGKSAVQAILAGFAEEAITGFRCELEHQSGAARIHGLVTLLNRSDYDAKVIAREDGCYVVEQRNCPMLALALEYPQICDEELRVYRNLLDVNVVRECRIAEGFSSCIYKVFLSSNETGIHSQHEVLLER